MATEQFLSKTFRQATLDIIDHARDICDRYSAQGYDLSLRQLYYQFVAANLLENTEKNYKNLGAIVSDARLCGLLDWDMIKDRGRETTTNSHWTNPADILDAAARSFRVDTWEGQPNHVEVMVEKQALEGVLLPVCRDLDIPFTANKGYSSSSALYEAGKRLEAAALEGKDLHVIYLGDHDPSGIDMTRDIDDRLSMFSRSTVTVHRVALNMEQVRRYNPPENPAKLTDSRSSSYVQRFGRSSWELDALEPATLANLVRDAVMDLCDEDMLAERVERQDTWKAELRTISDNFRK